jgi:hypothetical protein
VQLDAGSQHEKRTSGEKCYKLGWNPEPSNAVWAGPVSALRWVPLSAYAADWEAGNLLQRACGAMGLGDCTVGTWGLYTDPISPATLFDFFTEDLADWRHPLGHE